MKKVAMIAVFTLSTLLIIFYSCKKKEQPKKGCTDSNATNFCGECTENDGSCQYKATVQFWYNKQTSDSLISNGYTSLTIYVNNSIVGSYTTSVYFTGDPSCSQNSVVRKTMSLGSSKSANYSYMVKANDGDTLWDGSVNFDATVGCTSYQLDWNSHK